MLIDPKNIPPCTAYQLLASAVIPRPIGLISSISAAGAVNLAPFSFFNAVCGEPPMVLFCPTNRSPAKDTLRNVQETGEFVANIVGQDLAQQMNLTAGDYPPEVNEFEVAGLTPVPSHMVAPPYVRESPVSMECKLRQVIQVSDQPNGGSIVIGEVVLFHISDSVLDKNLLVDSAKLNPVMRLGGASYGIMTGSYDMIRPVIK
ncbi:MAG: flavin reductase family protein [Bryobacterales bacterium]|nr:flavin reductase family protein [Bryobacterales bacterium]